MFGIPIIGELIGNVVGIAGDWLKAKRQLKQTEVEAKVGLIRAKAEHVIRTAETGQAAEIDWDIQAMKNAGGSWKDEYLLILFSPPLVMAFIPGMAPYVALGFEALAKMPDWYLGSIGVMVAASFGMRAIAGKFTKKK